MQPESTTTPTAPAAPVSDSPAQSTAPAEIPQPQHTDAQQQLDSEASSSQAISPADTTPSSDNTPQATDPAIVPDATPDTTTPDRGVNPDKGIDPDAGDQPAPTEPQQDSTDPSQMTDQQRAAYFHQLRNAAKTSTEQSLDARYQPEAMDDVKERFMDQGYDEFQAQMLADREIDRQAKELAEVRAEVSDLNVVLATEAVEVVSTIPWLNPSQKDAYGDGKIAQVASQLYENFVTRDERTNQIDPRTGQPIPNTGTIIEAKYTPMQFYGALDFIRSSGASTAQVQAQRNAERQMASVAAPTSTTSQRSVAFESMSAKEQKAYLESKGHTFN